MRVLSMRTWIINPDAEIEMQRAARGLNHSPSKQFMRNLERFKDRFADLIAGEEMLFVSQLGSELPDAAHRPATYWCPTEGVRRAALRVGQRPPRKPDCLERCHDKSFLKESGLSLLPGRTLVTTVSGWLANRPNVEDFDGLRVKPGVWRLKRRFGFAGRGQRTVPHSSSPDDERWISDSLVQGGFIVEPEIERPILASIHGMISPGRTIMGDALALSSNESSATGAEQMDDALRARILRQGMRASDALAREGYFGPFGLDVVVGKDAIYALDLNPRFTLQFSRGLGPRREEALRLYDEIAH